MKSVVFSYFYKPRWLTKAFLTQDNFWAQVFTGTYESKPARDR